MKIMVMKASLAPTDLSSIRYPVLSSPKLDGIRAVRRDGELLTQSGLLVPNEYVRRWCVENLPEGLDGELTLRDPTAPFREVSSAIMSRGGEPDFVYRVFDMFLPGRDNPATPFEERLELAQIAVLRTVRRLHVEGVPHVAASDHELLGDDHLANMLRGYEGTMVRDPRGRYKIGRSTTREGLLLKIKDFRDDEATVLRLEEEMENLNDETARGVRGTSKACMIPKGRMGKAICRFEDGTEFGVGSGFDAEERETFWKVPSLLVGQTITVKHQPPPGGRRPGEAPRFPVFKGIRRD